MLEVTALGEALIDFSMTGADEEGYPALAAHPGGAPANFLAAVNRCGGRTALLTKVGQDAFGRLLVKTLERVNIRTEGVLLDPEVFTTLAFVTLDEKGERDFSFARKPGADTRITFEELKISLIDEALAFHYGTLSLTEEPARSATRQAVAYAKKAGKILSCDPNLRIPLWPDLFRAREEMRWAVSQADVVKLSEEEGEFLFSLAPKAAAEELISHCGVKIAFVTCGSKGSWYASKAGIGFVSAPAVNPVDTTGAGDIFGGTALYHLLHEGRAPAEIPLKTLEDIAKKACNAASLSTERPGGLF